MQKSFESSIGELEKIVKQLEVGDLPLEKSLKLFEDGVKLARECRERLAEAERKIEILTADADGRPNVQSLDTESLRASKNPAASKRIVFDETDEDVPF
ncbi:MAG: exodeoxyribonuclease VII small subunit [Acidobacteriota bacterium]